MATVTKTLMASVSTALALFVLGGCAGQPADKSAAAGDRVCINVRTINGFNPLSDRELAVTATANRHFLFTTQGICHGLRRANAIAVSNVTTQICNDGFGEIEFVDPALGRQSCRIAEIEPVGSSDEARVIAEERREARRQGSGQ